MMDYKKITKKQKTVLFAEDPPSRASPLLLSVKFMVLITAGGFWDFRATGIRGLWKIKSSGCYC